MSRTKPLSALMAPYDALLAVFPLDLELKVDNVPVPGQVAFEDFAVFCVHVKVPGEFDSLHFLHRVVPEELYPCGVYIDELPVRSAQEDAIFRFFEEGPVFFLRKAEEFLRPLVLREIPPCTPDPL